MLTSYRGSAANDAAQVTSATSVTSVTSVTSATSAAMRVTTAARTTFALALAALCASAVSAQTVLPAAEPEIVEESDAPFTLSANVALTSEYRFRGVDLSGGNMAIQGGFDLATSAGFYVGTWASSLDEDTVGYGSTEVDVYGGWSGNLSDAVSVNVGVIGYLYPDAGPGEFDYLELYGSGSFNIGPASATLGMAYAPKQDSLGNSDNLYLYTDLGTAIPGTPVTVTGHLGYTDGFLTFTDNGEAFDWSVSAETALYGPLSASIAYVGAEGDIPVGAYDFTDDAVVVTLSASF